MDDGDILCRIFDLFGMEDLNKYKEIVIKIHSPAYFEIKGKRSDGLIDRIRNHGYPLCKKTGKQK